MVNTEKYIYPRQMAPVEEGVLVSVFGTPNVDRNLVSNTVAYPERHNGYSIVGSGAQSKTRSCTAQNHLVHPTLAGGARSAALAVRGAVRAYSVYRQATFTVSCQISTKQIGAT